MTHEHLRAALKAIWGIEDKYLIHMSNSVYMPTIDRNDLTRSWIGYRFMNKERYARCWDTKNGKLAVPLQVTFRQAFVGPDAEELADTTLAWDDRLDVGQIFANQGMTMMYNSRETFVYAVKEEGYNDMLSWITDIKATGVVLIDKHYKPWFSR